MVVMSEVTLLSCGNAPRREESNGSPQHKHAADRELPRRDSRSRLPRGHRSDTVLTGQVGRGISKQYLQISVKVLNCQRLTKDICEAPHFEQKICCECRAAEEAYYRSDRHVVAQLAMGMCPTRVSSVTLVVLCTLMAHALDMCALVQPPMAHSARAHTHSRVQVPFGRGAQDDLSYTCVHVWCSHSRDAH